MDPSSGSLPESPTLPFALRCNLLWAEQCRRTFGQPWLSTVFTLLIAYRCWHLLTLPTTAWLLVSLALALADVMWYCHYPASYPQWRELPAALLRLNAFGPSAAWLLMRQLLDDHGAPMEGLWGCAACVLFASGAAKMAANALSMRVRLSLSMMLQAALFLAALPHTPSICAAAPLAQPAGQQAVRQLYQLIDSVAGLASMPGSVAFPKPSHTARCITLILWLRLTFSLLAPLLHEALSEARLWRQHQAQRRAVGLPRDHTPLAGLYRNSLWLFWEDSAVHVATVCILMAAAMWELVARILVPCVLLRSGCTAEA